MFIIAVGALVAGALAAFMGAASASPTKPPWLDPHKPIQARVNALLGAMTLSEKVGQMDQQLVDDLSGPSSSCGTQGWGQLNQDCMKTWLIDNKTGSLLAGGTDNPPDTTGHGGSGNTGYDWANEYNMIQQYAIQNSRLHIPLIFGVDAVHGFGHPWQAPLYPQSIGMGATWDPSAARAGGAATADAVRATGWNWVFAPVQDLARDNRWGRTYETWAEEPVLAAAMGGANIQGMQAHGPAGSLGVTATVKHFAGYSQSINGHDRNEALLPLSYLQSVILPSYAGGIDAGARTVMVDSGSINGVPATGSHYLLTDILRNQMHFQGVVISDYQDVQSLQTAYHVAANPAEAIAEAVNAGVDMAMSNTTSQARRQEQCQRHVLLAVVAMVAHGDVEAGVAALAAGASHYLTKPINGTELSVVIARELARRRLCAEAAELRARLSERYRFENIVGSSAPMQAVFRTVAQAAAGRTSVLLTGEPGTGKALIAAAIHESKTNLNQVETKKKKKKRRIARWCRPRSPTCSRASARRRSRRSRDGEKPQTTHFSVVDRWGNAVANTYTINGGFGSGVVVEGAGFLLNNEMDDFAAKPGVPNQFGVVGGDVNSIQPNKRPLSSMSPTIAVQDGKVSLVLGTPGGSRIFTGVYQVLVDVLDYHLPLDQAQAQPRFHHQLLPDNVIYYEASKYPASVAADLTARGWKMQNGLGGGDNIQAIQIVGTTPVPVPDPRNTVGVGLVVPPVAGP